LPDAIGHVAFGPTSFHLIGRRKKKLREKIHNATVGAPAIQPPVENSAPPAPVLEESKPASGSEPLPIAPPPSPSAPALKSGSSPTSVFAKGKEGFLKKVKEEVKKIQEETPKGVIDSLEFPKIWTQLQVATQKNEDPHLLALLQRCEPELKGDHELVIPFFNALEKETFAERREWMAEEFRRICGVYPQITFVEKEDSEAKNESLIYTPKEKLEYFLEQNPLVSDFMKKFNLDVDF
jgi:hypothetical protein